jgi:hypothetical protein
MKRAATPITEPSIFSTVRALVDVVFCSTFEAGIVGANWDVGATDVGITDVVGIDVVKVNGVGVEDITVEKEVLLRASVMLK